MGTVPGTHPAFVFAIAMATSLAVFFAVRLLLNVLYARALSRWSFFERCVERTRTKGLPLIRKYGVLGIALLVAIPLPGTGVYGGTVLSWLLRIKWQTALLAILPGAAISNGILTLSVVGIMTGIKLVV